MARGGPRKADGPSKKGSKATVTLLKAPDKTEIDIPPMPPAEDWIAPPRSVTTRGKRDQALVEKEGIMDNGFVDPYDEDLPAPEWSPAVVKWWEDIWTSPMASEFVKADYHGLYLGCYYLHESLNPFYKLSDRVSASKAFEATLKNFGLTPSAREGLRWQIAQGTAAQNRTNSLRNSVSSGSPTPVNPAQVEKSTQDMYRRNG